MTRISSVIFLLLIHSQYSHSFRSFVVNLNTDINGCLKQCIQSNHENKRRIELNKTRLYMSDSDLETQSISIPFDGSEDRFDRWRFLQNFLDGDHPSSDVVNIILYRVLEGVLKYEGPSENVVELTSEVKQNIEEILTSFSVDGRVKAVLTMSNNDDDYDEAEKSTLKILEKLETILPDPVENEDDYKSLWDTIIELHGRETVKFNESQNPVSLDWRIANTVTRVLLHYDFLTLGIINNPP